MSSESRKPDYNLWAGHDEAGQGTIGAGWKNDDGSIYIKLNAYVTLTARPGMTIKLYPPRDRPDRKKEERDSAATPSKATKKPAATNDYEDDIPF